MLQWGAGPCPEGVGTVYSHSLKPKQLYVLFWGGSGNGSIVFVTPPSEYVMDLRQFLSREYSLWGLQCMP
jgi:hypothetical protein